MQAPRDQAHIVGCAIWVYGAPRDRSERACCFVGTVSAGHTPRAAAAAHEACRINLTLRARLGSAPVCVGNHSWHLLGLLAVFRAACKGPSGRELAGFGHASLQLFDLLHFALGCVEAVTPSRVARPCLHTTARNPDNCGVSTMGGCSVASPHGRRACGRSARRQKPPSQRPGPTKTHSPKPWRTRPPTCAEPSRHS